MQHISILKDKLRILFFQMPLKKAVKWRLLTYIQSHKEHHSKDSKIPKALSFSLISGISGDFSFHMANFWAVRDAQRNCVFQGDESGGINIAPSPPPVVGRAAPDRFEHSKVWTFCLYFVNAKDLWCSCWWGQWQTHSGGIATPASCHRVGVEALWRRQSSSSWVKHLQSFWVI